MTSEVLINNLATCIEVLKMSPYHVDDEIKVMQDAIDHIKKQDEIILNRMVN
jgi:hypothetical protein